MGRSKVTPKCTQTVCLGTFLQLFVYLFVLTLCCITFACTHLSLLTRRFLLLLLLLQRRLMCWTGW
jgi:hypothetical protein